MKDLKCRTCEERYPACHSHCEYYIEWKKKHDAEKAIITEARMKEGREIDDQKYRISRMRNKKMGTKSY